MPREKKVTTELFGVARSINKLASSLLDMEAMMSGDPEKIMKRFMGKAMRKAGYKMTNGFTKGMLNQK
jgi:hypothetical protein